MNENQSNQENPQTAIVPADTKPAEVIEPYALLRPGATKQLLNLLHDNIGPAGIQTLDLPRVKVPSGGGTIWMVETLEGTQPVKTIEGIVLAWRMGRIFWRRSLNEGGGNTPPDCISRDGFVGEGDPGGECSRCPYAKFGSSFKGGKGQACKQVRQLLFVREDELLPCLLSVPPTSLKAVNQYFMNLFARGLPYWGVVTKISLERAKSEGGLDYAKCTFLGGRVLGERQRELLEPYHKQMQQMLSPGVLDGRDYTVEPNDEVPF